MKSKSCSPVRYGLSISGLRIDPTPNKKCESCRTGELFCCQISMSQTLIALSQTPALIPFNTKHKYNVHKFGECGTNAVEIPINTTKIVDVI